MKREKETKEIIEKIHKIAKEIKKEIVLMEACGTHAQQVARYGIKSLMPKNVKLISGPGCPVCVTTDEEIEDIVTLALKGVPIGIYGDVLKLRGYQYTLEEVKGMGGEVFVVYSIEEALKLSKKIKNLVFFAIGFETTAPMTAWGVKRGLVIYSAHKLFLKAMEFLVNEKEKKIDGFICPGHVSTIVGVTPYKKFRVPQVIAGFEPEDILVAIYLLLVQIKNKHSKVENEYKRSVKERGNLKAKKIIKEVFKIVNTKWRGFGMIPNSGLDLKEKYQKLNAKIIYKKFLSKTQSQKSQFIAKIKERKLCKCGEVLKGFPPLKCPLFRKVCNPQNPVGPCMVSEEGACNIEFRYNYEK